MRAAAALLAAVALLGGCATPMPPPAGPGEAPDALAGRIAVSVDGDGVSPPRLLSASFELRGSAEAGRLELSSPLGSMLAQAHWSADGATLVTPRGAAPYADLNTLARDMLGEAVPVAALFDWLRGRPWPGAPAVDAVPPAAGFAQLGWEVDLTRFTDALVVARRAAPPAVSVRARLDAR